VVDESGKGNFTSLSGVTSAKVKPGDILLMRGTSGILLARYRAVPQSLPLLRSAHISYPFTKFAWTTGTFTKAQVLQNINV
jgi:hypothetical protein